MGEKDKVLFTPRQIVEAILKVNGIKKGRWGLIVRFGMQASNVWAEEPSRLTPAALVAVIEIGVEPTPDEQADNNLVVDAGALWRKPKKVGTRLKK